MEFRFYSKPAWTPRNSLFEKDIGVTEYIGTAPGFTGVIKARFSDFQVNEIDIEGNVVQLTDQSLPTQPKIGKINIIIICFFFCILNSLN